MYLHKCVLYTYCVALSMKNRYTKRKDETQEREREREWGNAFAFSKCRITFVCWTENRLFQEIEWEWENIEHIVYVIYGHNPLQSNSMQFIAFHRTSSLLSSLSFSRSRCSCYPRTLTHTHSRTKSTSHIVQKRCTHCWNLNERIYRYTASEWANAHAVIQQLN